MSVRYTKGETATLIGDLAAGGAVTINVWKLDGTQVVINQPCVEVAEGMYVYAFSPSVMELTEFYWIMQGIHPQTGKLQKFRGQLTYGGWVDALVKEESVVLLTENIVKAVDAYRNAIEPRIDAKISTRATPADIKTFAISKIIAAPRTLEIVAKSVSHYYKGQVGTLVVMAKYAGAPTDTQIFATIYYPDDEVWKDEVGMIPLGETGLYTYSFLIPEDAPEGVYKVKYKATKSIAAQELADTFDEPDGLPSNWTPYQGIWNVVSNVLKQTGSSYAYAHWKEPLSVDWADYTFEYDTRADTNITNFIHGIIARYKSSTINYKFYYSKYRDRLCLDKGTTTIIEKVKTLVWNQWYKFKIELVGSRVKCYLDSELEFDWIDLNPITTGVPTLYCTDPHSFDNVLITIPAQEYQEFEVTDFMVGVSPAQEPSVQTIIDRIGIPTSTLAEIIALIPHW